jgi:hypothetical protein
MALDLYCERLGPGLLAEPINAFTNAAFLVAAWWILARSRSPDGNRDWALVSLAVLALAIGIGSTLFHTVASSWALLADVLPILLFQLLFLAVYLRRRTSWSQAAVVVVVAGFLLATLASRQWPTLLNGSLAYAPTLMVLLVLGWHDRRPLGSGALWPAAGLFALSLGFRSLDLQVCSWMPLGTHPLWHVLNGVVLALASQALLPRERSGDGGAHTGHGA